MDDLYYGHMLGWGLGGGLMMVVFWAIIIVFIVWLVKELRGGSRSGMPEHNSRAALDILKERYAKGEIGKEEFEEKKKGLTD